MSLTYFLFSMVIQNREKIWKKLKDTFCQSSSNQVAPEAAVPVIHEDNIVAVGTAEILNIVTISVYVINFALMSLTHSSDGYDTVLIRDMLALFTMALTHILWIVISQKMRKFTVELFTAMKNWCI